METSIDCLVGLLGHGKVEVLLRLRNGVWSPPEKKVRPMPVPPPFPDHSAELYWGHQALNRIHVAKPAVQVINLNKPQRWNQLFSNPGCIIKAKPGPAVLVAKSGDADQWFGEVTLVKRGAQADPVLGEDVARELAAWKGGVISVDNYISVLPPEWVPQHRENEVRLDSNVELQKLFDEMLHEEILRQLDLIAGWLPALRTRLELDQVAESTFLDTLSEMLLKYPAFQKRFEREKSRICATAEEDLQRLKREHTRIEQEISGLRERKVQEIGAAVEQLFDDDRILGAVAVLGQQRSRSSMDVSGVVAAIKDVALRPAVTSADVEGAIAALAGISTSLKELAARSEPQRIDMDALANAISGQKLVDLEPLVEAIAGLREGFQAAGPAVVDGGPNIAVARVSRGTVLSTREEIEDLPLSAEQRALAIVAHAGLLPVACGGRAAESVHGLLRGIVAGRATWWHCPADASNSSVILDCPRVKGAIRQARAEPKLLFALILEGIDRAPTEAYLEPILVMRKLNLPVDSIDQPWPKNLLVFATITCGGQTVLQISPGLWYRAVPIPVASAAKIKTPEEIHPDYWTGAFERREQINLTGLLPQSTEPVNTNLLEMSAYRITFDDPQPLARGIAVASCLAKGDGTKPNGNFSDFGRLLQ